MAARMKWHDVDLNRRLEEAEERGLQAAGLAYQRELKSVVNVSARGGAAASSPGDPPRKRTGNLQRNIVMETDDTSRSVAVGVKKNAIYGLFLELGTRFIAARPWMRPTLKRMIGRLEATARAVMQRFFR